MLTLKEPYNQFSAHDEGILGMLVSNASGDLCEIGCWLGHSTAILAQRAKETGHRLFVVDNFKGVDGTPLKEYADAHNVKDLFISNMSQLGLMDVITLLDMDSDKAATSVGMLTFLFIDGGHTYGQVASDIENYKHKVRGVICGHDFESETFDERHINEDYIDGKHHGVIKAVNEAFGKVSHEGRMWWVHV